MVNLEITGRMGSTTKIGEGQDEVVLKVVFCGGDAILLEDWAGGRMLLEIDELREIVARWDAGV